MLIALSLKCEPLGKFQELSTYHYSKESSRMRCADCTFAKMWAIREIPRAEYISL